MRYICEECGKVFNTEEECVACERKHVEERKQKNKLAEEKSSRYNEVMKAYEDAGKAYAIADELREKFYKDYPSESRVIRPINICDILF